MNRLTAVRVSLSLLLAAINIVMFGNDLAYDAGATNQRASYSLVCFALAFCDAIVLMVIMYGMALTWVMCAFFLSSFDAACLILGADIADSAASTTLIGMLCIHNAVAACAVSKMWCISLDPFMCCPS